jgi:alkyl hydroperoxide reductase subunit AhpC
MAVRLGDDAPNFTAQTTEGEINFYDWKGDSWAVLFSHPKDFTPVCTTELGTVAKLKPEFDKRNTKVIGLSVDTLDNHEGWADDIKETQGAAPNFPLISDADRKVSDLYDMIHPNANDTLTVRSVFIVGADNKVKLTLTYPASTGRNFDEILRVIDSLQLTANHKVATPADWKQGEDVIIVPALSDEEAKEKFPDGWNALKPYLRVTKQPS